MKRMCSICNEIKDTPYSNVCRSCYNYFRNLTRSSRPDKICLTCQKSFNNDGKICRPCYQNDRNKKTRSIACNGCGRSGLIHRNIPEKLCIKCDRKKKEDSDPTLAEKRRDYLMKYSRKKKGTDLEAPKRIKKGRWKTSQGYIMIWKPDHPNCDVNGCIREHTFVMTEKLGRPLKEGENVHHINGIRDDNRIENLELWHRGQCPGQRLKEKLLWCKEFLLNYGYVVSDPRGADWEVMKADNIP